MIQLLKCIIGQSSRQLGLLKGDPVSNYPHVPDENNSFPFLKTNVQKVGQVLFNWEGTYDAYPNATSTCTPTKIFRLTHKSWTKSATFEIVQLFAFL